MVVMQNLLDKHKLFETLFELLPSVVILVDTDYRVVAINAKAQAFFHMPRNDAYLQLCGYVFRCVNAGKPAGCRKTPGCSDCLIRETVRMTLEGTNVSRNKAGYHVWKNGELIRINVLVTATHIVHENKTFALVVIDEISNITQIQGLLPICYSCHRIREGQDHWTRLEEYIQKHSEADFTHDLCPDCAKRTLK